MKMRKAFKTGGCVVVALPTEYRSALKILPGSQLTVQLINKTIVLSRAITTPEHMLGTDHAGEALREVRARR